MDLLRLAHDKRKLLIEELEELEWFLRVADEILVPHGPADEERPETYALQVGPTTRIGKAEYRKLVVDKFRQKPQLVG